MSAPTKAGRDVVDDLPISKIIGLPEVLAALAPLAYLGKVATYTVTEDDNGAVIGMDASGGPRTVNLPAVGAVPVGFNVTVKKTDTTVNAVTLDGSAAETIEGAATRLLRLPRQSVTIVNSGSGWIVFGEGGTSGKGADYVRFADGYMRCWGAITITPVANVITTGVVTYPLAFSAAPKVFTTMNFGSSTQLQAGFQAVSSTQATIGVLRSNTSDFIVNWSAEGAWY